MPCPKHRVQQDRAVPCPYIGSTRFIVNNKKNTVLKRCFYDKIKINYAAVLILSLGFEWSLGFEYSLRIASGEPGDAGSLLICVS